MLHSLLNLRTNPVILFVGAFSVIFLIKVSTLLLPSQYYFSFSKLVSGDRGPFLVDPPSVSGKKMCGLLKKYGVSTEDISAGQVNCNLNKIDAKTTSIKAGKSNFSGQQIDFIYRAALSSDGAIVKGGSDILSAFRFQPMTEEQLESLVQANTTIASAQRKISEHYVQQLNKVLKDPIRRYLDKQFTSYVEENNAASPPGEAKPDFEPLSETDRLKLKQVAVDIASQLNNQVSEIKLASIEKTKVDSVLDKAYGKWDILSGVTNFYGEQAEQWTKAKITNIYTTSGMTVPDTGKAKKKIFAELSNQGLANYLISVALRIAPVLLFGFVLGFLFGPKEFISIGLAAALAAFLLSWPLMLLWENLVGHQWQEQKNLFLLFYAIYALSFFVTAHFAAVCGAFIRTQTAGPNTFIGSSAAVTPQKIVGWREVTINLLTGLVVNGAVYAWNVVIPLNAA